MDPIITEELRAASHQILGRGVSSCSNSTTTKNQSQGNPANPIQKNMDKDGNTHEKGHSSAEGSSGASQIVQQSQSDISGSQLDCSASNKPITTDKQETQINQEEDPGCLLDKQSQKQASPQEGTLQNESKGQLGNPQQLDQEDSQGSQQVQQNSQEEQEQEAPATLAASSLPQQFLPRKQPHTTDIPLLQYYSFALSCLMETYRPMGQYWPQQPGGVVGVGMGGGLGASGIKLPSKVSTFNSNSPNSTVKFDSFLQDRAAKRKVQGYRPILLPALQNVTVQSIQALMLEVQQLERRRKETVKNGEGWVGSYKGHRNQLIELEKASQVSRNQTKHLLDSKKEQQEASEAINLKQTAEKQYKKSSEEKDNNKSDDLQQPIQLKQCDRFAQQGVETSALSKKRVKV